jgi:pentatricopeptide repeat protein
MPELRLQRHEASLIVTLGEQSASIPLERVMPTPNLWQQIYEDAATYGRDLFEHTFSAETIKTLLAEMPTRERLLLIADDPLVAQIPWEYLRDHNNKLLASRLTLVRSVSAPRPTSTPTGPLEIIAIPSSPIDETVHLNVEQEWRHLVKIVTSQKPSKALTLKRLRPPTRSTLSSSLNPQGTSIVHFMGHGTQHNGKACLVFEDARGRELLVDATDLTDALSPQVFLVILNSCLSATVASTQFGNFAHELVRRGIPYALGMQCILPDEAALVLSQELLRFLLQGHTLEESVMHTRRALQELGKSSHPDWLAGLPVLYTSEREHPTPPLTLTNGQPTIIPDLRHLEESIDLTALPPAEHFLGRVSALTDLIDPLLSPSAHGFVMLHGLGGIGKTSLARVVAERVSWYYEDRVLAYSFETFATLDANNQRVVNEAFGDRFYTRLARLYQLDPAKYNTVADLQQAIIQRRTHQRSLLILDNIETLLDALSHPIAQDCAAFLVRLKDGDGVILLTSRMFAPSDWRIETDKIITLGGLPAESGADLFQAFLPSDRSPLAPHEDRLALSQRVQGHPLSIRLLSGRFADETALDLATFLSNINEELVAAERATPGSLDDPERQKTLYACMNYSVRRLTDAQRNVLDTMSIFQAPFIEEFADVVLDDTEQTPLHILHLVRLGLLNCVSRTFADGELVLFELHPMVRWYIELNRAGFVTEVKERYGQIYANLVYDAAQPASAYQRSALVRTLVRQSFVDCEAALAYLGPASSSTLAYWLAYLYHPLGQIRRTLDLYEQALLTDQELGDVRGVAVTQHAMAAVLVRQGKVQEALSLYEQALLTDQELGDVRGVAVTQHAMADVLVQQGKVQEALSLYEQALLTKQQLGDVRDVAVTQNAMAAVLVQQGKVQEALSLYEQALLTSQQLGDVREVTVTQNAMAAVLVQQGKVQEALSLYEQALLTYQELGDVRSVAVTQHAMAAVLVQQGKVQEALSLYEQALLTKQQLGDVRGVAVTQNAMADVLVQQGKVEAALSLYEQSLLTSQQLGDVRGVAVTQNAMANVLVQQGKVEAALSLYEQSLLTKQQLGDVREVAVTQNAMANVLVQQGKVEEALSLYEQSLLTSRQLGNVREVAVTQVSIGQLLTRLGEHQRALSLIWEAYKSLAGLHFVPDIQAVQRILTRFKTQSLGGEQFDQIWQQAVGETQPEWLQDVQSDAGSTEDAISVSDEAQQALIAYLNAANWSATRHVVETQQALLFQPEIEQVLEQLIEEAETSGDQRKARFFEQHLILLRDCKSRGIAPAFEELEKERSVTNAETLPFPPELIEQSVTALLGNPQEKMAYMQSLVAQLAQTTDVQLKALLSTIQLALFSTDLSAFGGNLDGVYRQAWNTIAASVEAGGVDPRVFEAIVNNTLAVLGPASEQRNEWRGNLADIRNQATVQGNRNMAAFVDAVIGLLDADGKVEGLGAGLQGIYARMWEGIVGRLGE